MEKSETKAKKKRKKENKKKKQAKWQREKRATKSGKGNPQRRQRIRYLSWRYCVRVNKLTTACERDFLSYQTQSPSHPFSHQPAGDFWCWCAPASLNLPTSPPCLLLPSTLHSPYYTQTNRLPTQPALLLLLLKLNERLLLFQSCHDPNTIFAA